MMHQVSLRVEIEQSALLNHRQYSYVWLACLTNSSNRGDAVRYSQPAKCKGEKGVMSCVRGFSSMERKRAHDLDIVILCHFVV